VEAARRQARLAQGHDPAGGDPYGGPPKARSPLPSAPGPTWVAHGPGVGVLALGEAATRLGMSRAQLEKMIDAGKVQALPVGFTRMIPMREVERLRAGTAPS
jgi:hypothetical protein